MKHLPRVLIVEDEPAIAELIQVNLKHGGFTPVLANMLAHPTFAKELEAYFEETGLTRETTVGQTLLEAGWTRADDWPEYLRRCAGTRAFVLAAASHRRRDGTVAAYRCEGALYEPRSADMEATVLLRLLPQESSSSRFVALTQKIK